MSLEYMIDGQFRQVIRQKINEDLAFPEKIRIEKAELSVYSPRPRKTIWKDGTGKVQRTWQFPMMIRVWDQDGVCGEGIGSPEVWDNFLPFMMGFEEAHTNLEWRKFLYWKERGGMARAVGMIETLLFDIIAKKRGLPVHRMLGAQKDYCDAYKGGGSTLLSDEQLVEEILSFKEEGFKATKFKMSLQEVERDVRRLEKVRKAVGPEFKIAVDSNQAWDAETCMEFLRQAYQFNIDFWEEPIVHTQTDEIRKLVEMMKSENVYVPLAYGENSQGLRAIYDSYINAGVEIVQPNGMNYTLAEGLASAAHIRSRGCRITSGQNHQACAFGALLQDGEPVEFHRPNIEGKEDYYLIAPKVGQDGRMHLPDTAGQPVQVDFAKLEKDGLLKEKAYRYR